MENSKLLCLFRGQLFDMAVASLNFHFALTRVAKKLSLLKHQNICQLEKPTLRIIMLFQPFSFIIFQNFLPRVQLFSKILRNTFVALKFSRP